MEVHNRTEDVYPHDRKFKKKNYKIKISFRCNACPFISFKYLVFLNVQNV